MLDEVAFVSSSIETVGRTSRRPGIVEISGGLLSMDAALLVSGSAEQSYGAWELAAGRLVIIPQRMWRVREEIQIRPVAEWSQSCGSMLSNIAWWGWSVAAPSAILRTS
jgi:hypothetical protein